MLFDSTRVRVMEFLSILRGTPGNPAPVPISSSLASGGMNSPRVSESVKCLMGIS